MSTILISGGLNEYFPNPLMKIDLNGIETCKDKQSPENPLKIGSALIQGSQAKFAVMCGEKSPKLADLCYQLNYEVKEQKKNLYKVKLSRFHAKTFSSRPWNGNFIPN